MAGGHDSIDKLISQSESGASSDKAKSAPKAKMSSLNQHSSVEKKHQLGGLTGNQPIMPNPNVNLPLGTGGTFEEGGKVARGKDVTKKQLKTGIYDTSGGSGEMIHKPIPRNKPKYGSRKDNTPADAGVKDYWKSKRKDTKLVVDYKETNVKTGKPLKGYKVPKIEKKYKVDKGVKDYWKNKKKHEVLGFTDNPSEIWDKKYNVDKGVKDYWKSKKSKTTLKKGD